MCVGVSLCVCLVLNNLVSFLGEFAAPPLQMDDGSLCISKKIANIHVCTFVVYIHMYVYVIVYLYVMICYQFVLHLLNQKKSPYFALYMYVTIYSYVYVCMHVSMYVLRVYSMHIEREVL